MSKYFSEITADVQVKNKTCNKVDRTRPNDTSYASLSGAPSSGGSRDAKRAEHSEYGYSRNYLIDFKRQYFMPLNTSCNNGNIPLSRNGRISNVGRNANYDQLSSGLVQTYLP